MVTARGAAAMEQQVLGAPGIEGIVLRYGQLYGPGTWYDAPGRMPGLHVDAAAQAALLALSRGAPGIYNIADDDGVGLDRQGGRRARFRSGVSAAHDRGSHLGYFAKPRRPCGLTVTFRVNRSLILWPRATQLKH